MKKQNSENWLSAIDRMIWVGLIVLVLSLIFSIVVVQAVIILLTLLWVIKIFLSPQKTFSITFLDVAVILFFLTRLVSILLSIDISISVGSLRKTPLFIMTYFVVSRNLEDVGVKSIKKLFKYLILSGILVSILGIVKYALGVEERVHSTTGGYTTLAIFLSAVFAFTLGAGFYYKVSKKKFIWVLSLFLMLVCLALTFSRSQWIATFVVILIVAFIKEKRMLPIALAFFVILVLISPNIRNRAITLLNPIKYSSERTIIWKGAVKIFPDHFLFGHGIGTFHQIFPYKNEMKDKGVGRWHNDYLQVYMESGLIGLVIFLYLIFSIFRCGISTFKKLQDKKQYIFKGMVFGIILSFITFFVQSFAAGFIGDPISSILFWFFVASLWAVIQKTKLTSGFNHVSK